ncbi:MAG: septal ring lytic transglycosylase RlpA family protein, partial [Desulfobacterales bacterium]
MENNYFRSKFDPDGLNAAHKYLPLSTFVRVTNLDNHRQIILRVNDRGPFVDGRIIDLSAGAAKKLGFYE